MATPPGYHFLRMAELQAALADRPPVPVGTNKLKMADAVKQLYREDARACEDWSSIGDRIPQTRPCLQIDRSTREALEREWVLATVSTNRYYSVDHQVERPDADGNVEHVNSTDYFQIVDISHARARPKLVHHHESADDPALKYGIALCVAMCGEWQDATFDPDDRLVYPEGDYQWAVSNRIADFVCWEQSLHVFGTYHLSLSTRVASS